MKLNTKFGKYGGVFVPELLIPALEELETAYMKFKEDIPIKIGQLQFIGTLMKKVNKASPMLTAETIGLPQKILFG